MVSWWGIDSYFNIELIQIRVIDNMILANGFSGPFRSRLRSKYIGHNTNTYRRSNLRSNPTPIHGPVQESDLNYSYLGSHFIRLPKAVAKTFINYFSQKNSYASKIIDPVIDEFIPNDESSDFHIFDHSIVTFGIKEIFIGLSNTCHVAILDRFRRSVVDKVK